VFENTPEAGGVAGTGIGLVVTSSGGRAQVCEFRGVVFQGESKAHSLARRGRAVPFVHLRPRTISLTLSHCKTILFLRFFIASRVPGASLWSQVSRKELTNLRRIYG
jgi:hypothetical protein